MAGNCFLGTAIVRNSHLQTENSESSPKHDHPNLYAHHAPGSIRCRTPGKSDGTWRRRCRHPRTDTVLRRRLSLCCRCRSCGLHRHFQRFRFRLRQRRHYEHPPGHVPGNCHHPRCSRRSPCCRMAEQQCHCRHLRSCPHPYGYHAVRKETGPHGHQRLGGGTTAETLRHMASEGRQ